MNKRFSIPLRLVVEFVMRFNSLGGSFRHFQKNSSAIALILGASSCLSQGAFAQDGGVSVLPEIVVEGSTLSSGSVDVARQGSSVSVVTGAELAAQQVRHAGDALRSLPGVSVSRTGSFGGLTQVRLRGAEANHTLVLIDGIEVNDATTGEFDFSSISTDQIERIEVIRGAQSGIWGSNALGGVINIITRKGAGPLKLELIGEGGSYSTVGGGASLSGGNSVFHGRVTYNERRTEGFNVAPFGSEEDGSDLKTFSLNGGMQITKALSVNLVLRNVRKIGDRDTEGGAAGTLAVQSDNPSHFALERWVAGAEAKLELFDGKWVQKLSAQHNSTVTEDTAISGFGTFFSENDGEDNKFSYLSTLRVDTPDLLQSRHFLTGLVEFEEELFTPKSADGIERAREHIGYVAEYRGEYFDQLFVSANIRHDDNDTFDDQTTWRTTAALKLADVATSAIGIRLHGSAGTAVKNPTMFEQFGFIPALFTPNPNLTPEESFAWDGGAEVKFLGGKLVVDVTYFKADLENQISTQFLPNFTSTPVNLAGRSDRQGVEVTAAMEITPDLTVRGAYTWLDATTPLDVREIRRAENSGRIDIDYRFDEGRGKIHGAAVYNGEMEDLAFRQPAFLVERVTLDDYWLLSLAASYEVQKGVEFFGRVENMLDEDYQEVFGFDTAGASVYGGVKVTFSAEEPFE